MLFRPCLVLAPGARMTWVLNQLLEIILQTFAQMQTGGLQAQIPPIWGWIFTRVCARAIGLQHLHASDPAWTDAHGNMFRVYSLCALSNEPWRMCPQKCVCLIWNSSSQDVHSNDSTLSRYDFLQYKSCIWPSSQSGLWLPWSNQISCACFTSCQQLYEQLLSLPWQYFRA
jgi:hypothetical protein